MNRQSSPGAQRGVSLIEVMVAILVFSLGMVGLALMQLRGAQFTRESGARSAAVSLARSLADAMRANPDGALPKGAPSAYLYDGTTTYTDADCNATNLSSPSAIATRDLACWQLAIARSLPAVPGGVPATVTQDPTLGTLVITVSWAGVADSASANTAQSYSFSFLQ
ncbi:type IV pilus modification protein PilV [Luteibacter sp. PPL552]